MTQTAPIPTSHALPYTELVKLASTTVKTQPHILQGDTCMSPGAYSGEGRLSDEEITESLTNIHDLCSFMEKQVDADKSLLEELTSIDRLLITKRLRVKSVVFLRGKKNRFFVRTPEHNLVYTIEEENSWWVGYCCYGLRPLQLRVLNSVGLEVMRINRPYACTARMFPCQLQHLEVYSPPGRLIGSIEQQWAAVRPVYVVKNVSDVDVFWIRGPLVTVSLFRDVEFTVRRTDGTQVGSTCKRWQGLMHAMFYSPITDRFGVAFEKNLTVEEKGLLLAATLLIDYMYYDV